MAIGASNSPGQVPPGSVSVHFRHLQGLSRSTWILESPILESIRAALCSAGHCATMPDAVDCDRVCHAAATPGHSGRYLENGKGKKTGCCCCCCRRRRRCRLLLSFQLGPKLPSPDHPFPLFWQRDDASSAAVTCRHLSFSILLVSSFPPFLVSLPCCRRVLRPCVCGLCHQGNCWSGFEFAGKYTYVRRRPLTVNNLLFPSTAGGQMY